MKIQVALQKEILYLLKSSLSFWLSRSVIFHGLTIECDMLKQKNKSYT